jgi:hypothetical protein
LQIQAVRRIRAKRLFKKGARQASTKKRAGR